MKQESAKTLKRSGAGPENRSEDQPFAHDLAADAPTTAGKLEIDASPSGQLAYTASKAEAKPGAVTVAMANMSGVSHNIAIESGSGGATGSGAVLGASTFTSKGTATVTVNLKPGAYTFFCQAPGHRAAGMYGSINVK